MSNKNIFIALMVAGGGLVAYALWKKKQKKSTLNMAQGWKPGDDPLEVNVTSSDSNEIIVTRDELGIPKLTAKQLLAQYGINT